MQYNLSNVEVLAISNLMEAVHQCLSVNEEALKSLLTLHQEDSEFMSLKVRLSTIKTAINRQEEALSNLIKKAEEESQKILSTGNF